MREEKLSRKWETGSQVLAGLGTNLQAVMMGLIQRVMWDFPREQQVIWGGSPLKKGERLDGNGGEIGAQGGSVHV